jgi:hypothetical protein
MVFDPTPFCPQIFGKQLEHSGLGLEVHFPYFTGRKAF